MVYQIDIKNKSTKDIILEYLKLNHGREIPVSEISETFNFKLARISNAVKELELSKQIVVERRPLKKGKYTVIRLTGDMIIQFATHERYIIEKHPEVETKYVSPSELPISKAIDLLISPSFDLMKFENLLKPYYSTYFNLAVDILQPLMYEIGYLWQTEKITVGDEHLVSERVQKFVSKIVQAQSPGTNKLIILAPSENEQHTLVLKILELLLLERRFKVINLAYTIDALSLVSFIKKAKVYPDWIFFSITVDSFIHNLLMNIKIIKEELRLPNLKIAIGGQGTHNINPSDFTEVNSVVKTNKELQDFLFSL